MSAEDIKGTEKKAQPDSIVPMPLQRVLPEPQPFPTQALGSILGPFVKKIAEIIQAPVGICGQSVLAAVALAVQGHADIEIDGRTIPLSEFFLTIGESGERKSAVDGVALFSHRKHQDTLRFDYVKKLAIWVDLNTAYEDAKKNSLRVAKSYDAKIAALQALGEPPLKPLDPLILMEEPTYEGAVKLLMTGQPSIGIFSDEGGRFIGGHGMNSDNLLKTAAGLCGFWDGKQVTRVRAGELFAILAGKRVSFHLMAQPNVAQLLLSNAMLIEQGLISRCLITWPASTAGNRPYNETDLTKSSEFKAYVSCIDKIFKTPLVMAKDAQNEISPRKIHLSQEAKFLFIKFHDAVERKIGANKQLSVIRGFANKAPEHALRLAGIVALFRDIRCSEIDTNAMSSGIELAKHYLLTLRSCP